VRRTGQKREGCLKSCFRWFPAPFPFQMLIFAGHIEDAFFWLCLIFYLKLLKYYRSANMDFVDYIMSSSLAVMDTKQNYAKWCAVKNENKNNFQMSMVASRNNFSVRFLDIQLVTLILILVIIIIIFYFVVNLFLGCHDYIYNIIIMLSFSGKVCEILTKYKHLFTESIFPHWQLLLLGAGYSKKKWVKMGLDEEVA